MSPTEGSPKRAAPEGTVAPYTAKWDEHFMGNRDRAFSEWPTIHPGLWKGSRHSYRLCQAGGCQSWAYLVRVPRTALVFGCGSWVRKRFVFRRSSFNHRSWISEPVLSSWSNCPECFEKSILLAPQSGRRPSVSVNRYSRPSSQELKSLRGGRLRAPQRRSCSWNTSGQGREEAGCQAWKLVDRRPGASTLAGTQPGANEGQA